MEVMVQREENATRRHRESLSRICRRIRARYPLLQETALVASDGYLGRGGFSAPVVAQAKEVLRGSAAPRAAASDCGRWRDPAPLRRVLGAIDNTPLLQESGRVHVVALPVGPRRAHVYWKIPPTVRIDLRQRYARLDSGATLTLRLYDITAPSTPATDIDLDWEEQHRYLDLPASNHRLMVEIGLRTTEGRFLPLARSNPSHTPSDGNGQSEEAHSKIFDLGIAPRRPARPRLIETLSDICDFPERDVQAEGRVAAVYSEFLSQGPIVFERIDKPAPRPVAILRDEYERRESERALDREVKAVKKAEAAKAADVFVARLDDTPKRASRLDAPRPIAHPPMPATRRTACDDPNAGAGKMLELARRMERVRAFAKPSVAAASKVAASGVVTTTLSGLKALKEKMATAGVEMEAELVLRGRVPRGKRVRIGGQIIEPEEDGTFKVACILRDGELIVPVDVVEAVPVPAN